MIKWSIRQEDVTIVDVYASNPGAPTYVRQRLTAVVGDNATRVAGCFTPCF